MTEDRNPDRDILKGKLVLGLIDTLASAIGAVALMGGLGMGVAWLSTRHMACNPYGIGGAHCCDECGAANHG